MVLASFHIRRKRIDLIMNISMRFLLSALVGFFLATGSSVNAAVARIRRKAMESRGPVLSKYMHLRVSDGWGFIDANDMQVSPVLILHQLLILITLLQGSKILSLVSGWCILWTRAGLPVRLCPPRLPQINCPRWRCKDQRLSKRPANHAN